MWILVVQESDWLKRNPHQQHHLMERLSLKGHEIKVIEKELIRQIREFSPEVIVGFGIINT